MFKNFFSKKHNYTKNELELVRFVLLKFGYRPNKLKYFHKALTHKSVLTNSEHSVSNERLEFLGDAILDAVIAEMLFLKFPDENEGYLTQIKSKVVSRKTLSEIGENLGLKSIIQYDKTRSINLSTLEGNAFEALIGAIYLDGGYDAAKKSILNHIFRKYANLNKILEEEIDFKSKLLIWCQKNKLKIEFVVLREESIQGNWEYEMEVKINQKHYGKGVGNSKKAAEQIASKEALILVGEIF